MSRSTKIFLITCLLICSFTMPFIAQAATASWSAGGFIVPCATSQNPNPCTFNDLLTLAQNVMTFIIYVSIPISAALFAYAGFTMVFSGGDEGAVRKAKGIFWNVTVGLVIVLVAWLVVYTIVSALVNPSFNQFINQ